MLLLINITGLEDLKILDFYITRVLALCFCCGKCVWTPCVELFSIFLKNFYCLFYCQVSGGSCRSYTACTFENCPGLKSKAIKLLFTKGL